MKEKWALITVSLLAIAVFSCGVASLVTRVCCTATIPPCHCGCMETGQCACKNCATRTADPTWKP